MSQIPIPNANPAQRQRLEALVHKLMNASGNGPQVAAWEQELNAIVYQLYDLTDEEIALVEEGTKL